MRGGGRFTSASDDEEEEEEERTARDGSQTPPQVLRTEYNCLCSELRLLQKELRELQARGSQLRVHTERSEAEAAESSEQLTQLREECADLKKQLSRLPDAAASGGTLPRPPQMTQPHAAAEEAEARARTEAQLAAAQAAHGKELAVIRASEDMLARQCRLAEEQIASFLGREPPPGPPAGAGLGDKHAVVRMDTASAARDANGLPGAQGAARGPFGQPDAGRPTHGPPGALFGQSDAGPAMRAPPAGGDPRMRSAASTAASSAPNPPEERRSGSTSRDPFWQQVNDRCQRDLGARPAEAWEKGGTPGLQVLTKEAFGHAPEGPVLGPAQRVPPDASRERSGSPEGTSFDTPRRSLGRALEGASLQDTPTRNRLALNAAVPLRAPSAHPSGSASRGTSANHERVALLGPRVPQPDEGDPRSLSPRGEDGAAKDGGQKLPAFARGPPLGPRPPESPASQASLPRSPGAQASVPRSLSPGDRMWSVPSSAGGASRAGPAAQPPSPRSLSAGARVTMVGTGQPGAPATAVSPPLAVRRELASALVSPPLSARRELAGALASPSLAARGELASTLVSPPLSARRETLPAAPWTSRAGGWVPPESAVWAKSARMTRGPPPAAFRGGAQQQPQQEWLHPVSPNQKRGRDHGVAMRSQDMEPVMVWDGQPSAATLPAWGLQHRQRYDVSPQRQATNGSVDRRAFVQTLQAQSAPMTPRLPPPSRTPQAWQPTTPTRVRPAAAAGAYTPRPAGGGIRQAQAPQAPPGSGYCHAHANQSMPELMAVRHFRPMRETTK